MDSASAIGFDTLTPMPSITIRELLDRFDGLHLATLKDPASVRCKIRRYFPPLHETTLDVLSVLTIQEWANSIRLRSQSQARGCIKILRQLYTQAMVWGLYVGPNLATQVKAGPCGKRSTFVQEHEMARLLAVLQHQPIAEHCYFLLMLTLFPRPGEAARMQVADLQFWKDPTTRQRVGQWRKPTTKNGRPQTVPIPPHLAKLLERYLQDRPRQESPWVFPGRGNDPRSAETWIHLWWEIRSQAGLDRITRHDLRRTGSTWANHTTGDLVSVSKGGLHHADLATTSIYVQSMDSKVSKMYVAHEAALQGPASLLQRLIRKLT